MRWHLLACGRIAPQLSSFELDLILPRWFASPRSQSITQQRNQQGCWAPGTNRFLAVPTWRRAELFSRPRTMTFDMGLSGFSALPPLSAAWCFCVSRSPTRVTVRSTWSVVRVAILMTSAIARRLSPIQRFHPALFLRSLVKFGNFLPLAFIQNRSPVVLAIWEAIQSPPLWLSCPVWLSSLSSHRLAN
ncbi:hypothetical protein C8R47DRAFT_1086511 [Mycena vitilis]|nr:hypothetical protein C8R47DRAFT_1086511 [Mycena vitilis]